MYIAQDLQGVFNVDPTLNAIFPNQPLIAYQQLPNLRNLLTSSKLPKTSEEMGKVPCQHTTCQLYPYIYTTDEVVGPNGFAHSISGRFQYYSTIVTYAICCQRCPKAV